MELVRVDRFPQMEEAGGKEGVGIRVYGRVMMDGVGGELEDGAGRDIKAVFEGVGSEGKALSRYFGEDKCGSGMQGKHEKWKWGRVGLRVVGSIGGNRREDESERKRRERKKEREKKAPTESERVHPLTLFHETIQSPYTSHIL